MRIFTGFLIMFASVLLWLLPQTQAAYDFRTDLRTDTFTVETGAAETTGNCTLVKDIYDDDVTTIELSSSDSDDSPLYSSYNATSRFLSFSGLAVSTNRTITVDYDVDALEGNDAIDTLVDQLPWIFIVITICFPCAGLALIIMGVKDRIRA